MPDVKNLSKLKVSAITWNMGNESASKKVADELISQMTFPNGEKPQIVALATQEEMAPNGKRLQDLMLERLNQGLPFKEQYELVQTKEPQFHTTMAGANHSFATLTAALLTSDNRVSCAIFVKRPCIVENARAQIDFESGKQKGNKSVITIQGLVKVPGSMPLNIVVSGGHFNAQSEQKRRNHARKYLEAVGIKTSPHQNFEQLYQEASAIKLLMGDFNERDRLMKTGNIADEVYKTIYPDFGFDIALQPELTLAGRSLHGTYGFKFNENDLSKEQITNSPDPTNREHVARGGYLDRITISTGLMADNLRYGVTLDENYFKLNKRGKWCYHYADHIPVVRNLVIDLPRHYDRLKIVARHIKQHIPHFQEERAEFVFLFRKCRSFEELKRRASDLLYHDSMLSPSEYLQQLAGADENNFETIIAGLHQRSLQKEILMELSDKLNTLIDAASNIDNKRLLETIYRDLRECNELRNAMQEVAALSHLVISDEKKSAFLKIASELVDLYYIETFSSLLHIPHGQEARISEAERKMDDFMYANPGLFDNFAETKRKYFNSFQRNTK